MKKLVSLLLMMALLTSCVSFASEAGEPRFFLRKYPVYVLKQDAKMTEEWPLFFTNDAEDMPWIDLEEVSDMLNILAINVYDMKNFQLVYSQEEDMFILRRENGSFMLVECAENLITFKNYNTFLQRDGSVGMLDLLSFPGFSASGEPELFQRDTQASFDRSGDVVELDFSRYGIQLGMDQGRCYLPLQTANDFLFEPMLNRSMLFNGQAMFFVSSGDLYNKNEQQLTPLGTTYYSAEPAERSKAFAEFGLKELSMMLDYQYGLKENHNIKSFDNIFWQIGYDDPLSSVRAVEADQALNNFISYYLDDLHSGFHIPSWMTGFETPLAGEEGPSGRRDSYQTRLFGEARAKALGQEYEAYQEVGNTAYVTFDRFYAQDEASDYYTAASAGQRLTDTIGLIVYANQQIKRENSPIENVVIDLSNNEGGQADAALFVISWILGEAEVSVEDALTGAQSTMVYRADVNLDRKFDEQDTLWGKHVYCLISPVSFSCGNLVPAVCKANQAVTLIGRKSGGGACTVQPMSSAWGSMFTVSGNKRLSFRINGSFYDVDEGVEPDVYISRVETLYDRAKLPDLINQLP